MADKCAYCGETNESVRTHSSILECRKCWDYRKMDRPASLHWEKVAREFLSNVDMWDIGTFLPVCGMTQDQAAVMLHAANLVLARSAALNKFGPEHTWTEEERTQYQEWVGDHKKYLDGLQVVNTNA